MGERGGGRAGGMLMEFKDSWLPCRELGVSEDSESFLRISVLFVEGLLWLSVYLSLRVRLPDTPPLSGGQRSRCSAKPNMHSFILYSVAGAGIRRSSNSLTISDMDT